MHFKAGVGYVPMTIQEGEEGEEGETDLHGTVNKQFRAAWFWSFPAQHRAWADPFRSHYPGARSHESRLKMVTQVLHVRRWRCTSF